MNKIKFEKPTVGQTVFIRPCNTRAGYGNYEVTPARVKKVGRKYFTIEGGTPNKDGPRFFIESWKHENGGYMEDVICYPTMQHYEDDVELTSLTAKIQSMFRWSWSNKFTLDQMRRVSAIIDEVVNL